MNKTHLLVILGAHQNYLIYSLSFYFCPSQRKKLLFDNGPGFSSWARAFQCGECSLHVCVGSLQVLHLPSKVQDMQVR